MKAIWLAAAAAILAAPAGAQQRDRAEPTLFPVRAVAAEGRVLATLPPPDADGVSGRYLYAPSLRTGLGSASILLDRGQLGRERVLAFRRVGRKVAAVFENPQFRAAGDPAVTAGARASFPGSVAAMLEIVSTGSDGATVVDLAPLLAADTMGVARALNGQPMGGKGFRLAEPLSAADPASLKAFPDNVEVDALQTFVSDEPGREVSRIAPDGGRVGFTVHHSFVRLPGPGYVPRRFDPRSGALDVLFYDYGAALGQDVANRLAARFRLEKVDPAAARSRVKKPIVFYVDRAAPEPIRTALVEGVNYWRAAFDKAGLVDAIRAEVLPDGVDPMDARYNLVNWSNRLTRGWSYGGGLTDPRTGEIVRGNVVIGALRVRQDVAILEALVGAAESHRGGPNDPVARSLDRIRQLGAHEVGHAIGFMHNFAASTQDRASVMDYPPPRVGLKDGRIDLSDAYAPGTGAWDDFAVDWLYADPAPGADPDAAAAAKAIAARERGLRYVSDVDGRDPAAPSPWGSMWDDGPDPVAHLRHALAVRRAALATFGPAVLRPGQPLAELRRRFVPLWLFHRYAVDAAGKLVAGIDYEYAVAGDNHPAPAPVPAARQLAALDALLDTLSADALTVPSALVLPLSAPFNGEDDPQYDNEVFRGLGAAAFDPLAAADTAAQVTLTSLLAPERLARLAEQHRRDPALPGLEVVLDRLVAGTVGAPRDAVGRRVAYRTALSMAAAARAPSASPEVAAALDARLRDLAAGLTRGRGTDAQDAAWRAHLARLLGDEDALRRELNRPAAAPPVPPGMPIGDTGWFGG